MDVSFANLLESVPVLGLLIWLVIRMQSEKEKLIQTIIEIEKQHTQNLIDLMCKSKEKDNLNLTTEQIENQLHKVLDL